jgi:REP element-mobilizing transposase RayT
MRRTALITKDYETELYKYITGTLQNKSHKMICINGTEDHVHILIGLNPDQSISSLMQDIKRSSSRWINENKLSFGKFEWQVGYGAFTYSRSQLKSVINYIDNQKEHHKKTSFLDEFRQFLKKYEVDYDERYIFKEPLDE